MRILQVAPLWERVPPSAYGGTEAVVSTLTDGLVAAGHDVVLRASGDSLTRAELRSVYPRSLRTAQEVASGTPYDWVHAAQAIADAGEFDVVHNHAGEPVIALAHLTNVPMLTTMHCLITPDTKFVWDHYDGYYNTISRAQAGSLPPMKRPRHSGHVYNAIEVRSFPFDQNKEDFLLFLGRVSPEKGTHLAIEAAKLASRKLIIAGKVDVADRGYYEGVVKPLIDGKQVLFVGEADYRAKRDLFRRASCLLMPITWEEPFGLVMIEAMACGTPVIAFDRGAAAELIADGETGFLVNDAGEMALAVGRLEEIRPAACRWHVERNFDVPVMVSAYLSLYERIATAQLRKDGPSIAPVDVIYARDGDAAARYGVS